MKDKITLALIIIFLSTSIILAALGFTFNLMGVNKTPEPENVNHEFRFNGKLYFYNQDDQLLGTYVCKTSECDYAKSIIDDSNYDFNYYKNEEDATLKVESNRYVFIQDGSDIIYYDIKNGIDLDKVLAVKNYNVGLENKFYIVKNSEGKWGVLRLSDPAIAKIEYKYSFIGINSSISDNGKVMSSAFVVKDENGWKIISDSGTNKSQYFVNPIYDYNEKYVITSNNNQYYLNTVDGDIITNTPFIGATFVGKYIGVIDKDGYFYVIDCDSRAVISNRYPVNSMADVSTNVTLEGIEIRIANDYKETLKID